MTAEIADTPVTAPGFTRPDYSIRIISLSLLERRTG